MGGKETVLQEMHYLQRYLVEEEIEEYREGHIPRRELIRRVLLMTGSIPATASILLASGCGGSASPTAAPAVATATSPAAAAVSPTRAPTGAAPAATSAAGSPTRAATPPGSPAGAASPGGPPPAGTPAAAPNPVTVSPNDPVIEAGPVEFPGQAGTIKGYKSQPRGATKAPGITVIHQNLGLNEHIKDIT